MHLFFIRHGETEHNVAGLLAGVSDSRLTNHGVLQTQRLGHYLTTHRNLRFTKIYASDLQRAFMTAEELHRNQAAKLSAEVVPKVVKLELLREQDFGSLELVPWNSRRVLQHLDPGVLYPQHESFRPQETTETMVRRAESFLDDFILPHFARGALDATTATQECVAVVSHGLFLSVLWRTLLRKFNSNTVALAPKVEAWGVRSLEHLPSWTNTGFLELTIERPSSELAHQSQMAQPLASTDIPSYPLKGCSMTIHGINSKDHLQDLKRTRGGLGSSPYDAKQQTLDGFFKRPSGGRGSIT
ncbi:hypothetical protein AYO21_07818 [Fonsecaea monophora]|uniref:Phosphoglycerate mutase n=1 Tax=Fonsecaea monophora TaxID=254056 RepID=A0A177F153_9EURO|nr:hypothetical protein AYO21_07818 [Fonsecaea monophora]KAH0827646.1 phosphoglycerate mutase family protein [Fonsecaea pedrosoi]OAG37968.1 hypothetical protein AYO21_07818 [Fonsecaea monophora]